MDATKLLIPNIISLSRSGNVQALTVRWDADGTNDFIVNTRDLMRLFGIPDKHIVALLRIDVDGSVAGDLQIDVDPKLKGQAQSVVENFQDGVFGRLRFVITANNDHETKELYGLNMTDELALSSNTTVVWFINFIFEYIPGEMFLLDDLIENIGDIRQVEIDRTPGQEWFQLGPVTQINEGTGEDIP